MILLTRLVSGFRRLLHAAEVESDLDEEVRAYFEQAVEQNIARGMTRDAAVRAARVEMGSVEVVKDRTRDVGWESTVETLWRDVQYAIRTLRRSPGFAAVSVLTLALGIGGNTAIFSVLQATSLGSSAYPDPDRLAVIWTTPAGQPDSNQGARVVEYMAWKERSKTFDHIGTFLGPWVSNLGSTEDGVPAERLSGWRFTASLFQALGVRPEIGRLITEEDDRTDGPSDVAVISHRLWQNRFGGSPSVLGRTMLLDGTATTIVGVMPPNFQFLDSASDFWIPMNFSRFQLQSRSTNRVLTVIGRFKPGISLDGVRAEMSTLAADLERVDPVPQKGRGVRIQLFDDMLFGNVRRVLRLLQGAVGFVLLIACANVAGLLLVRASTKQGEVALRRALGAGRFRLVRQFLTESLVLSLIGGLLGVATAWVGLRLLVVLAPPWLSLVQNIDIDMRVLAFSLIVSLLSGLVFGTVPALQVSSTSLIDALKHSVRGHGAGRRHRRLQNTLIVGQVALTLVLLVGAGLLIKSFWRLQHTNLGFQPDNVVSFQSRLPANKYFRMVGVQNGFTQLDVSPVPATLFDRVVDGLQNVPGVVSAAGTSVPPAAGGSIPAPFTIEGRPSVDVTDGPGSLTANYALITPKFFETLRIPIVRGREFTSQDTANGHRVAVINEAMARRYWPHEDPIGKLVRVGIVTDDPPREIVGIVGDTPVSRWQLTAEPALYVPQLQESSRYRTPYGQSRVTMTFLARINQPLEVVVPALRRAVAEVDTILPVSQIQMVDEYLARQVDVPRDSMLLVGIFGAIAWLLATFGIYGVVAYAVAQRTHEIGVRMALGARRTEVIRLVLRQGAILTVVGMIVGVIGATALTHYLENLLFRLTPLDPATFVTVALLFGVVAMLASYLPARGATKVDPLIALRCE
jgi:putative ABC transport system permease protein